MEEIRRVARKAAALQLIAHAYREHARCSSAEGSACFAEADALDQLAASLLSATRPAGNEA